MVFRLPVLNGNKALRDQDQSRGGRIRPQFRSAIARILTGETDAIILWKVTRFSRNPREAAEGQGQRSDSRLTTNVTWLTAGAKKAASSRAAIGRVTPAVLLRWTAGARSRSREKRKRPTTREAVPEALARVEAAS